MVVIDTSEFQSKILDYIYSEEFNKHFSNTIFHSSSNSQKYKQAMVHGMLIAGMMTSQCKSWNAKERVDERC